MTTTTAPDQHAACHATYQPISSASHSPSTSQSTPQSTFAYHITIQFEIQAPRLTPEDAAQWRYCGEPAIQGSLVRRNLRDALSYFTSILSERNPLGLSQGQVDTWFGTPSSANHTDHGRLNFDYAWTLSQPAADSIAAPKTGAAHEDRRQFLNTPFLRSSPTITARGGVHCFTTVDDAARLQHWLTKATHYLLAMGSLPGSGFGKILSALVTVKPESDKND